MKFIRIKFIRIKSFWVMPFWVMLFWIMLLSICGITGAAAGNIDIYHPDQSYRTLAFEHWHADRHGEALRLFRKAAYFGDKPSQLLIALMYHRGEGVDRDPVTAYAWSDLAAERGYPQFLGLRERLWSELDDQQRQRAVALGQTLYARYGDQVAKRRLEMRLYQGRSQATGSRTGYIGNLGVGIKDGRQRVVSPGAVDSPEKAMQALASAIRVPDYYEDRYWKPAEYWALQDKAWQREGRVEIGGLEQALDD